MHKKYHEKFKILGIFAVTTQAHEGIETCQFLCLKHFELVKDIQCLSPAKKYKLYKSSINKSIHFVQRSLSSSRGCGRFLGPELSNSKTASILHRTQTP